MRFGAHAHFTPADERALERAIEQVESLTSAEIRIHVESRCPAEVLDRAAECFAALNMHLTAARNGVLLYLAIRDRKFAVIGDVGIHQFVGDDFWEQVQTAAHASLASNRWTDGLLEATAAVGNALVEHFPVADDDENELTNAISWGW